MKTMWMVVGCLSLFSGPVLAAVYHVAGSEPAASDDGPGSADKPWKTLTRAAGADLKPGDTVLVGTGVYREEVRLTRSGEPGQPITFAAAPGAHVVIKGSDVITGEWKRLKGDPARPEPYPNAYANVWQVKLDDRFFPPNERRYISSVFLDEQPLQEIGPDAIYSNSDYDKLTIVGRDLRDIFAHSFFFDAPTQTLYVCVDGEPGWFLMEVGTRQWLMTVEKAHDVVVRGFEMRANRQPGGQWPAVSVGNCQRVVVEDCTVEQSDFCGLSLGSSQDCVVLHCTLSQNGDTGFSMGQCTDCRISDCSLMHNNTRRFSGGWHCGGMKNIPNNVRCTVQRCEVAYTVDGPGIWFDSGNTDCRILDNVVHDNDSCGIFYEINKGGGLIAGNLVYANGGRGIYISGSQKVWIVHNTVAGNNCGIVMMPREGDWTLEDCHVLDNLLLDNYLAGPTGPRGCDLTIYMGPNVDSNRTVLSNHSDYNLYAAGPGIPTLRQHWNPNNSLEQWVQRFSEDTHSRAQPMLWQLRGDRFDLTDPDAAAKTRFATPVPDSLNWKPAEPACVGCGWGISRSPVR